jgi:UPF0271 protein
MTDEPPPLAIDLNADVGEGLDTDSQLIPLLTTVNIACGGHAGTPDSMARAMDLALERGVRIGAHPGYADPENFGRRPVVLAPGEIQQLLARQLETLAKVAEKFTVRLSHVKLHGALYHAAMQNREVAVEVVEGVKRFDPELALIGLAESELAREAARAGLVYYREAFADRVYLSTGDLVPRNSPSALWSDPQRVAAQVVDILVHGKVATLDGQFIPIKADTLCLHGDTPGVVEAAQAILRAIGSH